MREHEALDFFNEHSATCTMCGVHHAIGSEYTYCFGEELGDNYEYITYEDAVEAALEYCLTRLI